MVAMDNEEAYMLIIVSFGQVQKASSMSIKLDVSVQE
jgi:hypothetical protein